MLLNVPREGCFKAYSAGSDPRGEVNLMALEVLQAEGYDTGGLSSKSWDVFARPGAPVMDFVFTRCVTRPRARCARCGLVSRSPRTGFADPAAVEGDRLHRLSAFRQAHGQIRNRLRAFTSLPIEKLARLGDPA